MKSGLLGGKLGHSYSPQIHRHLGDYSYALFEKTPDEVDDFMRNGDFDFINVTIPYKKDVIPYCAQLSDTAKAVGAVNTIVRRPDGSLIGHNTDYFGFELMVKRSGLSVEGKKVLILGSGGAAMPVRAVLREMGAHIITVSRSGENHYGNLHLHKDAAVIVNTTPVGMYPKVGVSPVDLDLFPNLEGVLDVIYNPARPQLLLDAEQRGLVTMNGLLMLVAQAKESTEWFTGRKIPDDVIDTINRELKNEMENIVLVGMPGSGKSTVGVILSQKTGKKLVDSDAYLEAKTGRKIPEIFATDGEAAFRTLETEVLAELGKQSGLIISTGGGCVTQERNYPLLHQNGTIFCITRDVRRLSVEGRPLSHRATLEEMYRIRKPMYTRFADYFVDNNGKPEHTADTILKLLEGTL